MNLKTTVAHAEPRSSRRKTGGYLKQEISPADKTMAWRMYMMLLFASPCLRVQWFLP